MHVTIHATAGAQPLPSAQKKRIYNPATGT